MKKDQVIALDGPSGSGKSTVAKMIAAKLGLIYIDTGAMFRAAAYALQHTGIDFTKEKLEPAENQLIEKFFHDHRFQFAPEPGVLILLDNLNLTDVIREHHVSRLASQVSRHKVVRDFLKFWQRDIVKDRPAILDGRDIGTVIFPNAVLKVFLTASAEERAHRRTEELKVRGQTDIDFETILKDIKERDYVDMNREIAPLKKAEDGIELDSTGKSIPQIVDEIVGLWEERKGLL
ncbi:(d)CMP kinase [Peredibacter starrii]|uniref:Cytidylate kinase n=1 Tax=Peredibacter starrii TaxID=28202 RepID=A0AAX4HSK5_9BACT|nr:(d)CMP kinase [Peredibacter starrii]WPU66355.1 (d)CMP kinase [Peredibacter starrii]